MIRFATLPLFLVLAACGQNSEEPASSTETASTAGTSDAVEDVSADDDAAAVSVVAANEPPAAWSQCQMCHSTEEGKNGLGPSLAGIVGREAGTVPGFAYSPANRDSAVTWTEETLDPYLENPRTYMPGNRMSYAGLKNAEHRAELIEWLKTI